jgi:hypothetical protein
MEAGQGPNWGCSAKKKFVTAHSGLIKPDTYNHPLTTDVCFPHVNNNLNCEFSYRNFTAGNYALLYNILSTCDWSGVHETSSVDVAVASLSAAVLDVMEQAVPRGYNCTSTFPLWFFKYYITTKNLVCPPPF